MRTPPRASELIVRQLARSSLQLRANSFLVRLQPTQPTGRRAAVISLVTFILMCLYHVHIFWTYSLRNPAPDVYRCTYHPDLPFMSHGYNYLVSTTYSILPFLLVFILNINIVVQLKRHSAPGHVSSTARNGSSSKSVTSSKKKQDKNSEIARLTTVLFLVSFSWLILSLPFLISQVIPRSATTDAYSKQKMFLFKVISFQLMWINNAINFFLYCLSGQKLRSMIFQLICGKCLGKKKPGYISTTERTDTSCV